VNIVQEFGQFIGELLRALPALFPRFALAWLIAFAILVVVFSSAKERVRHRVTKFDESLRAWGLGLRYRDVEDSATDRVARTWFFRFWTNFASAPSLSVWSVLVPFYWWLNLDHSRYPFPLWITDGPIRAFISTWEIIDPWLFPGLCYAGSMLLSFVTKRYFKRQRPPREGKAFGYKLKDPSFPSGHSLTSFCFWFPLTFVIAQSGLFGLAGVLAFGALAAAIVLLTGLSRVYLGVHFPSDVMGGYTMGIVWCIACYFALWPALRAL
jgi:membrane-associated phospholipid phosphatase